MAKVRIITDATAHLEPEFVEEHQIGHAFEEALPFTALLVALSTKYRWAKTKISSGSTMAMAAPARMRLGLSEARPRNTLSDNVRT